MPIFVQQIFSLLTVMGKQIKSNAHFPTKNIINGITTINSRSIHRDKALGKYMHTTFK